MFQRRKVCRLLVFAMAMLLFAVNVSGCFQKKGNEPGQDVRPQPAPSGDKKGNEEDSVEILLKHVYPSSISITNGCTVLKPGEYQLTAEVSPKNAVKGYKFQLVGNYEYAQVSDNNLVIGREAPDNAKVVVKVSSKYDPQICATKMFVVSNEIDWVDIATEEELLAITDNLNGNYRLVNNIRLTKEWPGIGTADTTIDGKTVKGTGFSGRFDGNGFTIYDFNMTDGKGYNKGFFYQTEESAIIEKLSLKGVVYGSSWCGALVGINKGVIRNCITKVEVKTAAAPCAAFVGSNKGTIWNCIALGSAAIGYSAAGHGPGFVNVNDGTIKSSYALADTIEFAVGYKKGIDTAISRSSENLRKSATYADWDDTVWYITDGKYPCLRYDGFDAESDPDRDDPDSGSEDTIIWTDIRSERELRNIAFDLNGNYRLANDIVLTENWTGVGKAANGADAGISFNGRFNGNGYTISGFKMQDENGFNLGFFLQTGPDAIVENLRLVGSVSGRNYCSALVGIHNGIVRNCVTEVDVTGKSAPSSGFVGTNNGKIINCYALGQVTVAENNKHGAGFVNVNHSTKGSIQSSFALDSSMKYAVGYNKEEYETIRKSEVQLKTADTFADWDTAIWYIADGMYPVLKYPGFQETDILPQSVVIEGCDDTLLPGDHTLWAKVSPERAPQDVVFSLLEAAEGVTLEGDILSISGSAEDGITITIKVESAYNPAVYATKKVSISSIAWTDISTEEELRRISEDLGGNYRLVSDIKLTDAWTGIGRPASGSDKGISFNGRFNGNGHTITGFSMENANGYNMGFFMQTGEDAIIEKLKLEGTVNGRNYCSALVGINNGTIKNCMTDVAVSGKSVPSSGFVGTNNGTIAYCIAVGSVSVVENGKHGAGFVNSNHATKGVIRSSYALDRSMPYAVGYHMVENAEITKTENELKTADTYKDWDRNIWIIQDGSYPIFRTELIRRSMEDGFLDDFSSGISMDRWNISIRKWGSLEESVCDPGKVGDISAYPATATTAP